MGWETKDEMFQEQTYTFIFKNAPITMSLGLCM